MPAITAILHTHNDSPRLGRALETLRSCDEIVIVDHGSRDDTARIAREYGARMVGARAAGTAGRLARNPWIFCLRPTESISEALEAALFEWKRYEVGDVAQVRACSVFVREQADGVWSEGPPETRLVPREWDEWSGDLPKEMRASRLIEGDLLRFREP